VPDPQATKGDDPRAIIDGPTKTPVDTLVQFDAGGSTGGGYAWHISGPEGGRWLTHDGHRRLAFASPVPGIYRITLAVAADNRAAIAQVILHNGTPPDPDDEDPDDEDPVDPPKPDAKWQVVIVYESNDLDNMPAGQVAVIKGLAFREKLAAAGHTILHGGITDQHVTNAEGETPAALSPFLAACKGKPLPRICVSPIAGGPVQTFALPANEADTLALLQGVKR